MIQPCRIMESVEGEMEGVMNPRGEYAVEAWERMTYGGVPQLVENSGLFSTFLKPDGYTPAHTRTYAKDYAVR